MISSRISLALHARSIANLWKGDPESWIAAGVFVLIGLLGLLRIRQRRRRRRDRLVASFEELNRRAVELLDEIEAVTKRHQLLPFSDPDFKEPMEGATLAQYERIEHDIQTAREAWVRLMGEVEQMQMLIESGRPLRGELKRRFQDHLHIEQTVPPAQTLLDHSRDGLTRLEQAHEETEPARAAVQRLLEDTNGRVARLADVGISTVVYEDDLAESTERVRQADAVRVADPLGAAAEFEAARQQLQSVDQRIGDIETRVDRWRALIKRIDATAAGVSDQRAEGLRLEESEGNPDPLVSQARQEAAAARLALDRGEAAEADSYLELGETWQERADDVIRRHQEARQYCRRAIPERVRKGEEIRASLAAGEAELQRLAQLYAEDSWRNVADHVRMARRTLDAVDPMLEQARIAAGEADQRYFFAEDLLVHIEQQQAQAAGLLEDVTQRGRELETEREAVQQLRRTWEQQLAALDRRVQGHREGLSREAQEMVDRSHTLRDALRPGDGLPNWPHLRRQLEQALDGVRRATQQIEEEMQARERFMCEIERAEQWAQEMERYLNEQPGDRARSMDAVRSAQQRLRGLRDQARGPDRDWLSLVDELEVANGELGRAREWAQQDMTLYRQAEQALAQADREVNLARGFYEQGVSANARDAEAMLRDARLEHRREKYETAIDLALRAGEAAHAALEQARRQSRERKRAVTQKRLTQVAGTVLQAAAAYYGARHGSRHGYGRVPPISARTTFPSRTWGRR